MALSRGLKPSGVARNPPMRRIAWGDKDYDVRLTRTMRRMDVARFVVHKLDGTPPYTVTFQNVEGTKGQCDCPAGRHRRTKQCRHQKMLAKYVPDAAGKRAQQALPFPKQEGPDPRVKRDLESCRAEYQDLSRKLKAVADRGKKLKAKLG